MAEDTGPGQGHHNFGAVLARRAAEAPAGPAYTFLRGGPDDAHTLTYGELHAAVAALAARLARFPRGARALLLYPHGPEFVRAFWACLLAGIVPVPCYPPRNARSADRLLAIAADAQVSVVLTDPSVLRRAGERLADTVPCLVTESVVTGGDIPDAFPPAATRPDDPALLQYTSGSTGAPKGVVVSHRNLYRNQELIRAAFGQDSGSTIVSWLPFYHDMGLIGNVLHSVHVGAHAVFLSPVELLRRPLSWLEAISHYRATGSGGPNFGYQHCVDRVDDEEIARLDLSGWRVAYCGAELVREPTLTAFAERFAPAGFRAEAFRPCYGMAEATLLVSAADGCVTRPPGGTSADRAPAPLAPTGHSASSASSAPSAAAVVSCGVPRGFRCVVVGEDGAERPDGEVGEVWLSGASIASGYWNDTEASEAFRARTSTGEGPFYRTGDLGFLRDGELHVTGRTKELVIVRGRNHYPYDLEWAIAEGAPGVARDGCVVFSVDGEHGEELIVLCEYRRTCGLPHDDVIRSVRTVLLEEYGIAPAAVFLVADRRLPRTSSGKLQRTLCKADFLAGRTDGLAHWTAAGDEPAGPEPTPFPAVSDAERLVAEAVQRCRGPLRIGRDDTFFGVGLDSLGIAELAAAVSAASGRAVGVEALYTHRTVPALAAHLDTLPPADEPAERTDDGPLPLSAVQEAIWVDHQSRTPDSRYNIPVRVGFPPGVPRERVEEAVAVELGRAELLRCRIVRRDGRLGLVPADSDAYRPQVLDLTALDGRRAAEELDANAGALVREPFDLDEHPLFRAVLTLLPDGSSTLILVAHHVVCDGFSLHALAQRLLTAVTGAGPLADAKPDTSYRGYVLRQRRAVARDGGDSAAHRRERLADAVPLRLPRDRRPAADGARGPVASRWLHLSDEESRSLAGAARRWGTTPFAVALTAFATVIGRITRRTDVVLGVPLLDRDLPAMKDTFGPCVNPATLRVELDAGRSGADRAAAVTAVLADALRRRAVPESAAAGERGTGGPAPRTPLTSVYFNGLTFAAPDRVAAGFLGDQGLTARLDLDVYAALDGDGRGALRWDYDTSLFEPDTVRLWTDGFRTCLHRLTERPDEPLDAVPLLVPPRPVPPRRARPPAAEAPADAPPTLLAAVRETMARHPGRTAVVTPRGGTTYGELLDTSLRVAAHLREEPGDDPVGLCFRAADTAAALAAMVGALDAGRRYVVLEPRDPAPRLRRIVADAGVRTVLAAGDLPWTDGADGPRTVRVDEIHAAPSPGATTAPPPESGYLLYTSGTSGTPKAVIQRAENVRYFVEQYRRRLSITERDTLTLVSSLGFDAAVLDVWTALVTGARLEVLALHESTAHRDLWQWAADRSVTVLHTTPSLYRTMLATRNGPDTGRLRAVVLGGEPVLTADVVRHFELAPRVGLHNLYGQAENTLGSLHRFEPGHAARAVTLGTPCDGTTLKLRTEHGGGPEVYEVGEIVVGSAHVARGYLGLPGLTAAKFPPGGYRTGDLGRFLPSGEIELVGRADRQVKVNGYRVEPAEIETVLTSHPAVTRALVRRHRGGDGTDSLTAYAEIPDERRPAAPDAAGLRDLLARSLPAHMVPAAVRVLGAFPLTPNNKVDTARLPPPGPPAPRDGRPERPLTERERAVAACVEDVLGVAPAGPETSFFELGGNSIGVIELLHRLERTTGLTLSFKDVFEAPTVAAVAARLAPARTGTWPELSRHPARPEYPATSAQTRIWVQDQRTSYNVLASAHVAGGLEPRRLARAVDAVTARHAILRTRFALRDDEVVQRVEDTPAGSEVLVERVGPDDDREQALTAVEQRELHRRFDLATGPLFQVTSVTGAGPHDVLMLSMHHIVCDAISVAVFTEEVLTAYARRRTALPEPAVQYGDYALWLRDIAARGLLEPSRAYWHRKLKDGVPALRLRTDRPRGPVKSFTGAVLHGHLDETAAARARELCRSEGVTLFTLLHATLVLTLHERTGQTDLCLGTLSTGREFSRHLAPQLGFLANTLALRTAFTPRTTFRELLALARTEFLESHAHQLYPLEQLADVVPHPGAGRGFLFDVLLVLHDHADLEERVRRATGIDITLRRRRACVAKFDLTFNFVARDGRVETMVEFDPGLYDEETVALLWRRFTALLAEVTEAPGLPLAAYSGKVEEERTAAAGHDIDFDF
ncbi:condensation domain-containing protein [Streptomyces sp. CRN 30]|uniref:condensation domain-containing protein n=1 Tax=Streptomyces sp. CRN 30 TaxID=3075613 RepID=UPI002A822B03|nr:condensation domain-containing protein [Streptomyces sp. CRN 30]